MPKLLAVPCLLALAACAGADASEGARHEDIGRTFFLWLIAFALAVCGYTLLKRR